MPRRPPLRLRDRGLPDAGRALGRSEQATAGAGWNGTELVAFRLHLPSKILYHNTGREIGRGNILVWEQSLEERRRGIPIVLDARMDPQSILYRTIWLFGTTFVAVVVVFIFVIWWVMRRGSPPPLEPAR